MQFIQFIFYVLFNYVWVVTLLDLPFIIVLMNYWNIDVDSEKGEEEDVNYISGTGFQSHRFGNKSGYMKFNGAG